MSKVRSSLPWLLTFRLGGTAKLPATAPYDETIHPVDDAAMVLNPADVAAGGKLFINCVACHGGQAESGGAPGPDLRESGILLDAAAFRQVVLDGGLLPKGMPQFKNFTDEQLLQLRSYIRQMARNEIARQAGASKAH